MHYFCAVYKKFNQKSQRNLGRVSSPPLAQTCLLHILATQCSPQMSKVTQLQEHYIHTTVSHSCCMLYCIIRFSLP